jgi:hypothetical protein
MAMNRVYFVAVHFAGSVEARTDVSRTAKYLHLFERSGVSERTALHSTSDEYWLTSLLDGLLEQNFTVSLGMCILKFGLLL